MLMDNLLGYIIQGFVTGLTITILAHLGAFPAMVLMRSKNDS